MTELHLSSREELLLTAALNPDSGIVVASWHDWISQIKIEDAPYAELRLLPAVYAHLSRIAPSLQLSNKLRGNARATFTQNNLIAHEGLPAIDELSRHTPIMVAKGLAMCIRFDVWSSRTMGDLDIHVPFESLEKVCKALAQSGWTPKYGMTWASLVHRSSLRRDSWNCTKGRVDLDLHWRFKEGPAENWLGRCMWASAERVEFRGRTLLVQSPEFAFMSSLIHAYMLGTHADALQTIVDSSSLLPICKANVLIPLLGKADLFTPFRDLVSILGRVGLSETVSNGWGYRRAFSDKVYNGGDEAGAPGSPIRRSSRPRTKTEKAVLHRPICYRLWESFGRKARIERLIIRLIGPFSKPLTYSGACNDKYDLRECDVIDQIGGPGWSWPEPEHTCFWSDLPDARLLIPLRHCGDHLIVLEVSEHRASSPNPRISIFANGTHMATLDFRERMSTAFCMIVPRRVLSGPWVELSLRPKPYLAHEMEYSGVYSARRSVPARWLRVFDMQQLSEFFSAHPASQLQLKILKSEEPQVSKFDRIKNKIANSPYRNSSEIPADFDPILYVLSYADLFEHEVDPYEHFVCYGKSERRSWR